MDGFLVQPKEKTEYDVWNLKYQERVEVAAGKLSQYDLDIVGVLHFGTPGWKCVYLYVYTCTEFDIRISTFRPKAWAE